MRLELVTPVLGGSASTRAVDEVDIVRAPTVRGHLRFWWRALYAAQHASVLTLYERESRIWGRAATDEGGRSGVEIRIDVEKAGAIDKSDILLYDSKGGKATPGAYALWPAGGGRVGGGVEFTEGELKGRKHGHTCWADTRHSQERGEIGRCSPPAGQAH
ncbi:MAG TPA: type III-B CRISPR module RAMP protein Cmr1 [Gemmatimonadales bacterium]|nr:type III-B CRISPR module RAMP protein Cmr1 [Gemmatimonadales bacterium]